MSKADVLQLVDVLSGGLADQTIAEGYYYEVVRNLAAATEQLVASEFLPHAAQQAVFDLPADAVRMLAAFYDGRQLSPTSQGAVESVSPDWRDRVGTPQSVIEDTEADSKIRVTPKPLTASAPPSFVYGEPLGRDYPDGTLHVLYTNTPQDIPAILEMPVALLVCAREFARESPHSSVEFSKVLSEFGTVLLSWL